VIELLFALAHVGRVMGGMLFTSPGGALEMKEESASVRDMVAGLGYRTANLGVGRRVVAAIVRRGVLEKLRAHVEVQGPSGGAGASRPFTDVYAPNFKVELNRNFGP